MRSRSLLCIAAGVLLPSIVFASPKLAVKVQYSAISNLVHQLDCVSKSIINCSTASYQKLWEQEFLGSELEKRLVQEWVETWKKYQKSIEPEEEKPTPLAMEPMSLELAKKGRIAAMQAQTAEDYYSRLNLVLTPRDRAKVISIFETFNPKFMKWWIKEAAVSGAAFTKQIKALLSKPAIGQKLDQFTHFFESEIDDTTTITFNLYYRPDVPGIPNESTNGEQLELFSLTEFRPKENPEHRLDVVIHELCHFLFDEVSIDKKIQLQNYFLNDGRVTLMPAYNLMNEALATAMGNGIASKVFMKKEAWEKYFAKPKSFYNNDEIDLAGKTIIPLIETWISDKKTIYNREFVRQYITSLEKAFGPSLTAPKLYLSELFFQASGQFEEPFRRYVNKQLKTSSMWASQGEWQPGMETFKKNPRLNSLFIVHPKEIDQLERNEVLPGNEVKRLRAAFEQSGSVLYSFQRSKGVFIFVIIEKDYKSALKLVDLLAELKTGFNGIYSVKH